VGGWVKQDGGCGVGDVVRDAIGKAGIVPMRKIWDNGFRQITSSSSRQLNSVGDIRGFKIRVPVTALLTSLFSGLGALPSSISYSELYSALQTHIVEGQENPLAQVSTGKLYEVQKYCALSNHCWSGYWILGNRRAIASLPPDLLELVNTAFDAAAYDRLYRTIGAYEASKLESDHLVRDAARTRGLPLTRIHPGAVIGDSRTGETTQWFGFAPLVEAAWRGKLPAVPGREHHWLPLVTVDFLAAFIARVPEFEETRGGSYMLLDDSSPQLVDLVAAIEAVAGPEVPIYSVRMLDHTLPFYLRRTPIMVEVSDELEFGIGQEPGQSLPTLAAFEQRWTSGPHALALMSHETHALLRERQLPMTAVAEDDRRVVVANFESPRR